MSSNLLLSLLIRKQFLVENYTLVTFIKQIAYKQRIYTPCMNTTNLKEFAIEYYDYPFSLTEKVKYQIKWSCKMIAFHTCGNDKQRIHALQYVLDSAKVSVHYSTNEIVFFGLNNFIEKFPSIKFDLKFNCHGWTFTNGQFLLMDHYIPQILSSEYLEVGQYENHDIVVFKCLETGEWIHSCKKETQGYSHKDWIKDFYKVDSLLEIISMPQYDNCELHYFKRKKRDCHLMCLKSEYNDVTIRSLTA